jgi:hypothetical protein
MVKLDQSKRSMLGDRLVSPNVSIPLWANVLVNPSSGEETMTSRRK